MRPGLLDLSPDERLLEIAGLLAAGARALRDRTAVSPVSPAGFATSVVLNSAANCLELPAQPRLSVHTGLPTETTPRTRR